MDKKKLEKTMKIIDEAADIIESDVDNKNKLSELEQELKNLTGKQDIDIMSFAQYWTWIELEELARSVLMPLPVLQGLSDEILSSIINNICECRYSESETYYQLKVLKCETGIDNISDYIFYPDEIGLDIDADTSEIISRILSDRKR